MFIGIEERDYFVFFGSYCGCRLWDGDVGVRVNVIGVYL